MVEFSCGKLEVFDNYPDGTILPITDISSIETEGDSSGVKFVKHPLGYFRVSEGRSFSMTELTYVAPDSYMYSLSGTFYGKYPHVEEWIDVVGEKSDLSYLVASILCLLREGDYFSGEKIKEILRGYGHENVPGNGWNIGGVLSSLSVKTKSDFFEYSIERVGDTYGMVRNPNYKERKRISDLPKFVEEEASGKVDVAVFREMIDEVTANPPKDSVEIAKLCLRVDEVLKKLGVDPFGKEIMKTRKAVRDLIFNAQRAVSNWERLSWGSRDEVLKNVRSVLQARLGLPDRVPEKGSQEWEELQKKISGVTQSRLVECGLNRSYSNKWFKSNMDVLIAAFDEDYDIAETVSERGHDGELFWKTREETLANVFNWISGSFDIPEVVPERNSDEWSEIRGRILGIGCRDFMSNVPSAITGNKWFSSYIDVLVELFDEGYDVSEELEKRRLVMVYEWKTREEAISNVRGCVIEKLGLPEVMPEEGTKEFCNIRFRIALLSRGEFEEFSVSSVFKTEWYKGSCVGDVLIDVFPEFKFKQWCFTSAGIAVLRIASNPVKDDVLISENDLAMIHLLLNGDARVMEYVYERFKFIGGKRFSLNFIEENRTRIFDEFLKIVKIIGVDSPVSLFVLWSISVGYVASSLRYARLRELLLAKDLVGTEESGYADVDDVVYVDADDVGEDDVYVDEDDDDDDGDVGEEVSSISLFQIMGKFGSKLSLKDQELFLQLKNGEVDLDDPDAQRLISMLQDMGAHT